MNFHFIHFLYISKWYFLIVSFKGKMFYMTISRLFMPLHVWNKVANSISCGNEQRPNYFILWNQVTMSFHLKGSTLTWQLTSPQAHPMDSIPHRVTWQAVSLHFMVFFFFSISLGTDLNLLGLWGPLTLWCSCSYRFC